jgi:sugar phosphate isomerase/epimerase
MKPTADQLIDYAVEHELDSILLNSFRPLESREDDYLDRLKDRAGDHDIRMYVGAGSISENSTRFSDRYGNARELLQEGIRVAAVLGSPVVVCRIGTIEDRYTEGGIEAHIETVIDLMNSLRPRALDAGVRFAFENHAGDLRSGELLALIEETGTDVCGALLDFGNAIWAMEDPMRAIETLARHILCTSVRDVMIWPTEDGAIFQWTAIGQGLMDYPLYAKTMARLCPGVPLHVESISNSPRPVPYLTSDFWKGFPDLDASEIVDFLKLVRRGHPLEVLEPPEGVDKRTFDIRHQQSELKASLDYLRANCHVGLKA